MPYTPHVWSNGDSASASRLNNIEGQYAQATNSFEQDLFTPFVLSGLVCTKDGSIANQLDVTTGVAFPLQADGTLYRIAPAASTPGQFTTSAHSTTYYLDLNVDGTWSFATSHSGMANYLTICQLTTDGSGNISTVTDKRTLSTTLFANAAGSVLFAGGALTGASLTGTSGTLPVSSQQTGSANGITFKSWNGSAGVVVFSIGGQFSSAPAYIDNSGNLTGVGGTFSGLVTFNHPQSGSDASLVQLQSSDASPAARWTLNSRHADSALYLVDNTNGVTPWVANSSGALTFNAGGAMTGINSFTGSASGTYTHGLSATPTSCWVIQNVAASTDTMGSDTYGSSSIHINVNASPQNFTAGVHRN